MAHQRAHPPGCGAGQFPGPSGGQVPHGHIFQYLDLSGETLILVTYTIFMAGADVGCPGHFIFQGCPGTDRDFFHLTGFIWIIAMVSHPLLTSAGSMCHQAGQPVKSLESFPELPVFRCINSLLCTVIGSFRWNIDHMSWENPGQSRIVGFLPRPALPGI